MSNDSSDQSAPTGDPTESYVQTHPAGDVHATPPPLPPHLVDGTVSGDAEWENKMLSLYLYAFLLCKQRHAKYGPLNISRHGVRGVLVRLGDKLARLDKHYFGPGESTVHHDETINDTLTDIANYALIAMACREGFWPGVAGEE